MSTLEKTIGLLKTLPEEKIKIVYTIIRSMEAEDSKKPLEPMQVKEEDVNAAFGIAHKYANPELWEQEEGAWERAVAEKYAIDRR